MLNGNHGWFELAARLRLKQAGCGQRTSWKPAPFSPATVLLFLVLLVLANPARAAPPPPGTVLLGQAELEFYMAAPGQPPPGQLTRTQSNPVRAIVDTPATFALTPAGALTLKPGDVASWPHRLIYTGPAPAAVTLSFANRTGDDSDLNNLRCFQDLNTNGVADSGEPLLATGAAVTLAPGVPFHVVILGDVPRTGVNAGQMAAVRVDATVPADGLSATADDRVTVVAGFGALFAELTASRQIVEIGDTLEFTLRLRNASGIDLDGIMATNDLPAGFAFLKGTATLNGQPAPNPLGGAGPRLVWNVGGISNDAIATITFRVRARPGTTKGDGITRGWGGSRTPRSFRSNIATVRVDVKHGGVFTDAGVVLGKVYIDANQNRQQDVGELGVPGIRIFMEDGTYVITDGEGKYNFYGVSPRTHVLKLDEVTLPQGAELLAPSTRHAGSGGTRFVDINRGELHKADFTVSYATPEFVDAVRKRRVQAAGGASEIESTVKGRLTPDGAPLVTGDPRSMPAAGIVGGPVNSGPSLTTGLGPNQPRGPPGSSAPSAAGTNAAAAQATDAFATGRLSEEIRLEDISTNTLGFLGLKDGDTLPMAQANVRVRGVKGSTLTLGVDGQEVPVNRVGRKAVVEEQNLEIWEYVGVPLKPGTNHLSLLQVDGFRNLRGSMTIRVIAPDQPGRIKILLPKDDAVADGRTPARVRVQITDARGVPVTARLPLTLDASVGQWLDQDLDLRKPGTQVFIEGGQGEFLIAPPLEPGESHLRINSGVLQGEAKLAFLPELRPMVAVGMLEGTINLSDIDARKQFPRRSQDGFEEELQAYGLNGDTGTARAAGRAAFFVKGKVLGKYLLTAGYDSDKDTKDRLFRDIQPDEFYPVYGDSSVKGFEAQSTGRLYIRVDRNRCYVLHGDFITASAGEARALGNYSRSLNGQRLHLENKRYSANLWASEDSTRQIIDEMRGNGTSGPYEFSKRNGLINSEKVEIITRDRHQASLVIKTETLARFTDYEFEPFTGRLLFRRPIPSIDENLNPVFVRVTYEIDQGGDKFWVYGADGQVKVTSHLELGGAAVRDENPLGSYNLYSANSTLKLAPKTFLIGEFAHSETGTTDGQAGRVELRHSDTRTDAHLYFSQAGTTFSNSAAGIAAGRQEAGAKVSYRLDQSTRLVGQAIHSESLGNNGRREGETLSIERTLPGKAKLEVGVRHSTETAAPASGSTAGTPGTTPNEVNSIRGKLTVPVPLMSQATVYGEVENDLVETEKRLLAAGGEYQFAAKSRLYFRHEFINAIGGPFELNNFQAQNTTVVGLDTEYMKEGSVFNEYRGRSAFDGREAEAAIGLRNGWHLGEGLRLNTTLERITPIEGNGQNEATAGALGLEYTRNPDWKGTARLEVRTSPTADSLLNTLGYARKISRDWTMLGRTIFYGVENKGASSGEKLQGRFQAGVAYRQTETDRWHALAKYELKYESDSTPSAIETERIVHILSAHVNYQPARDWILSGHYAGKLATEDTSGLSSSYDAHLCALRATYDLTKRLDVGINTSVLFDGGFRSVQFGFGPEVGWTFKNNMRVSSGFNLFGFKDRDLTGQDYTNPGFFVSFRFKFDETLFGMGNNLKEGGKP